MEEKTNHQIGKEHTFYLLVSSITKNGEFVGLKSILRLPIFVTI